MDVQIPNLSYYYLCLLALLLPLLYLKLAKPSSSNNSGLKLPPGPWQLPIIGSLHHLLAGPLPHRIFCDLARRHGPIMYLKLGEIPAVVVSSADGAREIMRTHDIQFATRPVTSTMRIIQQDGVGIVMAPYDEHWRQMRKICIIELLSAKRVQSFRRIREEEMRNLVNSIISSSPSLTNLTDKIAAVISDIVMLAMIGERFRERDAFLQALEEGVRIGSGFNLEDTFPSSQLARMLSTTRSKAEKFRRDMSRLMDSIIQQHQDMKANKSADSAVADEDNEDLLDVLLRIQKEGDLQLPLETGTIKAVLQDVYGAGSETSATTLIWAMAELMKNPKVMEKAQREVRGVVGEKGQVTENDLLDLKYLKSVIKETLRLHPAAPLLVARECRETTRILGYDVPKGAMVLVNALGISTHPDYWDLPDKFDPERFEKSRIDFRGTDYQFIPFGSGRRICPGMGFAQASMEIVLATLLYHFDWELPNGVAPHELDMDEASGGIIRRKTDLKLNAILRFPISVF